MASSQVSLPLWQRALQVVWDKDMFTKSPAERKLVFKLDVAILTSICLSWLLKYIDQANLANAYVSGMKEDLDIQANEYTYMGTCFNVALTVMTLCSNIIVLKVRPSIWLPLCEIGWGIFTFAQAGATSSTQMYAFRTLLGLFEASFAPVVIFLLGSWYTKSEMAKRMSIWYITGPAGAAFSGFLQAAIYTNLNGSHGIAGWRWLYIICGCMTIPIGIFLYFVLPDFPSNDRSWYFTDEERELARKRCAVNGVAPITGMITLETAKHIFSSWRVWVIVPTYVIYACGIQSANYFAIWLKSAGFTVADRNLLSSLMWIIGIPLFLLYGAISDRTSVRYRWLIMAIPQVLQIIPTGVLAVWPESNRSKEYAFLFCQIGLITHIFYTYTNEICKDNAVERGFIIGAMNAMFFCFNAWLPIVIFPQTDAPKFRKGFPTTFGFAIAALPLYALMRFMHARQLRQQASNVVDEESTSSVSDEKDEKMLQTS